MPFIEDQAGPIEYARKSIQAELDEAGLLYGK